MYITVKTVQKKIPVTEDMLMLVLRSIEGGGEIINSEIKYTYSLQNRYNYDWVFEEENKTIKKIHRVNSL